MKILILLTAISFFAVTTRAQQYPKMITVEGGSFTMGGTESDEKPTHTVTISSFSMGKYEVTVAEYKAFCRDNGYTMPTAPNWGWNDKHPMVNVTFDNVNAYCNWLSKTTGKSYRLPTEAEWEYAARGGNKSRDYMYAGSDDLDEAGWSSDNAPRQIQACGGKKPNELGLYDMSGNAWEWCKDWYRDSYYKKSPSLNPKGPSSGHARVMRGGSWFSSAASCRVALRHGGTPALPSEILGFRVVVSQ